MISILATDKRLGISRLANSRMVGHPEVVVPSGDGRRASGSVKRLGALYSHIGN
jgi:hypothetical protein